MAEYTVRQGFVVFVDGEVYSGGDRVELTDELYKLYKHRLEGSDRADSIEFEVSSEQGSNNGYPAPYISSVFPPRILSNTTTSLTINGSFFTPETTVKIEGATVTNVEFVSSLKIIVSISTSDDLGSAQFAISNGQTTAIESAVEVKDKTVSLIDLRVGGTDFSDNAIEVRDGMTWLRKSDGLEFNGRNPFGSWARLVGDDDAWVWNREQKRDLSFIFTNNSSFMLGIGSRASNQSSNLQYYQAEILGFFGSATSFNGLFGNRGRLGSGTTFGSPVTIDNRVKKITFRNNGEAQSKVSVYNLPGSDISDWLDESTLIAELTVPNSFAADEEEIMPFIIPRSTNRTLFLGMILL